MIKLRTDERTFHNYVVVSLTNNHNEILFAVIKETLLGVLQEHLVVSCPRLVIYASLTVNDRQN